MLVAAESIGNDVLGTSKVENVPKFHAIFNNPNTRTSRSLLKSSWSFDNQFWSLFWTSHFERPLSKAFANWKLSFGYVVHTDMNQHYVEPQGRSGNHLCVILDAPEYDFWLYLSQNVDPVTCLHEPDYI